MEAVNIPLYTYYNGSFTGVQYVLSFTEYQYFRQTMYLEYSEVRFQFQILIYMSVSIPIPKLGRMH